MAQNNPNRRVSTNQAASAPAPRESRLYTEALHPQPIQNSRDIPGRNKGPLSHPVISNQDLPNTQLPCNGVRGNIPKSPNHRCHRRSQRATDSRLKQGSGKSDSSRPNCVRHWKNTPPWRANRVFSVSYDCYHCGDCEDMSDTFCDMPDKGIRDKYEKYECIREMFEGPYVAVRELPNEIHGIVVDNFAVLYKAAPKMTYTGIRRTAHNPDRAGRCQGRNENENCGHRRCAACPVISKEECEKVLEKVLEKDGKRSHDRRPRPKYVMSTTTE